MTILQCFTDAAIAGIQVVEMSHPFTDCVVGVCPITCEHFDLEYIVDIPPSLRLAEL
jgi:hypothetical protein